MTTRSGLMLAEQQLSDKQVEIETLHSEIDNLHKEIDYLDQIIRSKDAEIAELEVEIETWKDKIEALEHEIDVLMELGQLRVGVSQFTDAEKIALKRIAMAEAGNQGVIGKALVMLTVLNRVDCPGKFGSTVEGVILSGAYTVTLPGGGYWTCVPDWECEVALFLVLHGWNESILCEEYDINPDLKVIYFTNQGYSYGENMFRYRDHWFGGFEIATE